MAHVILKGREALKAIVEGETTEELIKRKASYEDCLRITEQELEKRNARSQS